ncbi:MULTISPECIES: pentapeptide repeat-containing protein [Haloferax]|uniref:Pentapeptide repeat-containing protein n=1 Tax=Haloferax marinum TaxID=2666143 RepID=A0A6A8G1S6_9EURY|nr:MULTISPECIES: pentapeptide repeat-containing protein [Haloferax]KAB1196023.1 hypothetical protein Hfx1150_00230 [Haloferax sp. CBA1150]MRW95001.1 hypothetical protein [Haloferax marinum]
MHVDTAWTIETVLYSVSEVEDPEATLQTVAETLTDGEMSELLETPVSTVLDHPECPLDITTTTAVDVWEETVDLPETCERTVVEDGLCAIHTPADHGCNTEGVVQQVESGQTTFVGGRFDTLDFSDQRLSTDDASTLDFGFSTVGVVDFSGSIVENDLSFDGARLGQIDAMDAKFVGNVSFVLADLGVDDGEKELQFGDNFAQFAGDVRFHEATFERKADFKHARFHGATNLSVATFRKDAMFNGATFDRDAIFMGSRYDGKADFSKAVFHGLADLVARFRFNAMFNYTRFESRANFSDSHFAGKVDFWATVFGGKATFDYVEFDGYVSAKEVRFEDATSFEGSSFQEVTFDSPLTVETLNLARTTISDGRFTFDPDVHAVVDLTKATFGDVDVEWNRPHEESPLERLHFDRTTFDGFDFSAYHDGLSANWDFIRPSMLGRDTDKPEVREETFLKAKNGAKAVGDDRAASEFYLREMRARRDGYWTVMFGTGPLKKRAAAGTKWAGNRFFDMVSGYGERPSRTVLTSVAAVCLFAGAYWNLGMELPGESVASYLTFSFQTFVALLFGGVPEAQPVVIRFVVAVEAFTGAFAIALFVFGLTQTMRR